MKPIGLGEHGQVTVRTEDGCHVAYVRYRDFGGRLHRIKRLGQTKAAASRRALNAVDEALAVGRGGVFSRTSTYRAGLEGWMRMFDALVERGRRSPTTRDLYANVTNRLIIPRIGDLRLGELTPPVLDRFVQGILAEKGTATAKLCRSVLSGSCGWLVRQGGLATNPVRDLTPLEVYDKGAAKALALDEMRRWLRRLDGDEFARRHDLPELSRFMLATGVRIGEALGVTWADVDLVVGVVQVQRTIVPIAHVGLVAKSVKSKKSERGLVMPAWCVAMLKARRIRLGAFDGPVFASSSGGWRDRGNVGKAIRKVRGDDFAWLTSHTYRKTVATLLDEGGSTARMIADQLGHARVSMTQDVYIGRRPVNAPNVLALEAYNPDLEDGPADED